MEDDRCFVDDNRYFKSTTLKRDAEKLMHHDNETISRKATALLAAIGSMSNGQLGKALEKVEKSGDVIGGYRLVKIAKEGNVVLYQIVKEVQTFKQWVRAL